MRFTDRARVRREARFPRLVVRLPGGPLGNPALPTAVTFAPADTAGPLPRWNSCSAARRHQRPPS